MEENPKRLSWTRMVAFILLGALAGCAGALFGVLCTTSRGILNLPEDLVINALLGGPLLGIGAGFTVARLSPRREWWSGCLGWGVLLVYDLLASSVLAGLAFYIIGRLTRR